MELKWNQITASRAITDDTFSSGLLNFDFSVGSNSVFIPSKSYFRVGVAIAGQGGATPKLNDAVALADNFAAGLISSASFQIGGADVSTVSSFYPQASQLKLRLTKDKSWMDSIGKDAYHMDADFQSRVNKTAIGYDEFMPDEITQRIKLGTATHDLDYQVLIATNGNLTTNNVSFDTAGVVEGDKLLVNGVIYTVNTRTDIAATVTPSPAAAVDTTANGSAVKLGREEHGEGRHEVYAIFQPPCGIFDSLDVKNSAPIDLGSGQYKLVINPNVNYKLACVEKKSSGAVIPTNYNFKVKSLEFYACMAKENTPSSGTQEMELKEIALYQNDITSLTGEQVFNMTVPTSTYAISMFIQDSGANNSITTPPTNFTTPDRSDLKLTTFSINYGNVVKPTSRYTSEFTQFNNLMQQRYLESNMESGQFWTGGETMRDWIKRGPIYHATFEKARDDPATQLQISASFNGISAGCKLFAVAHYTKVVSVVTQNGYVANVTSRVV